MGSDISKGVTYTEGQQVNAANLNAHVDDATIKYTAISSKSLKNPASLSDEILINDAGVLKKITLQQISSLVTIPPGTINDYAGTTEPTGWLLCYGQAVSRVTYASLFDVVGVAFGAGDGSSTFNLPDCRGRVSAGKDNMGGSSADRISSVFNGDILGGSGGVETHILTTAQLPSHSHTGPSHTHTIAPHGHTVPNCPQGVATFTSGGAGGLTGLLTQNTSSVGLTTDAAGTGATGLNGSGASHPNLQPTIIFNKIIKI
jgi:microcystin-dependent protein